MAAEAETQGGSPGEAVPGAPSGASAREASLGPGAPRLRALWAALAFILPTLVMGLLYHPSLPTLLDKVPSGGFNSGHVWVFDHIRQMLLGARPFTQYTPLLNHPQGAMLQPIAWAPALFALPFGGLLGPIGAYTLILLLSPGLSALSAYALLRRLCAASPALACAAALPFGLSPFMLGTLASGQIAKAQGWILCLPLLGLAQAMGGPARWRGLLLLGISGLGAAFTSPSLLMQLPFALVLTAGALLLKGPGRLKALAMGALSAGMLLAAVAPAYPYYEGGSNARLRDPGRFTHEVGPERPPEAPMGFFPSNRPVGEEQVGQSVAHLGELLTPRFYFQQNGGPVAHISFLPWPMVLAALALALLALAQAVHRRRRPAGQSPGPGGGWALALGLALLACGVTLALGEYLFVDGRAYRTGEGDLVRLPALWLWGHRYPLGISGAYYRVIALATLGLTLALGAGASRIPRPWGALLAWTVALASIGLTLQGTRALWPVLPQGGMPPTIARAIAADPLPGALLDLPFERGGEPPERLLKDAALHRRAIWALPRPMSIDTYPPLKALNQSVEDALSSDDPPAALRALGFAFVVLRPSAGRARPSPGLIRAALGPPDETAEGHSVWRLDP